MRTWKCRTCGRTVERSYEDLAQQGVPICGEPDCDAADSDMELLPAPAAAQAGEVFVRFECGSEDRMSGEYGPFPFVQLTYNELRVGPDDDGFAYFGGADGFWRVGDGKERWSDVVIGSAACAAPPEAVRLLQDARQRLIGSIGSDCECDNTHAASGVKCCLCQYRDAIRHAETQPKPAVRPVIQKKGSAMAPRRKYHQLAGRDKDISLQVTDRQFATILAALRFHQDENLQAGGDIPDQFVREIATDGGLLEPLNAQEVDKLCERFNASEGHPAPKGMVIGPPHREGGKEPLFRVVYVIDVNADDARAAARRVHEIMIGMVHPEALPPILDVMDHRGKTVRIDLSKH